MGTPGTDDVGGPKQAKSVNCVERQNGVILLKKSERRMTFSLEELKLFQSVAARFNFLAVDRPDLLYSVKELAKMASPRAKDLIALKRVARYTIKYEWPADSCGLHWTVTLKSMATRTLLYVFLRESPQLVES